MLDASRTLRHRARTFHLFAHIWPFEPNIHAVGDMAQLPCPTHDSRQIVALARTVIRRLYSPEHAFPKAGAGMINIVGRRFFQFNLLHPGQSGKADRLMDVMDRINRLSMR